MDAFGYLMCPSLQLYERFSLRFAFRTTQLNGLLLFNSDVSSGDFILFELHKARLFLSFDMGSGLQRYQLSPNRMNDNKWHKVEMIRYNLEDNVIATTIDKGELTESEMQMPVTPGNFSKNFNLADSLYIGGAHETVFYRWREQIANRFGFQVRAYLDTLYTTSPKLRFN
ncbi:unnamed protein product [Dicrocoelium dendriticum]|nr:unnamed protein product [Dicrocoelium dendriticum]